MWRPCLRETLSIGNASEILQFCTKLVTYSLLTCPSQEPHSRQRCRSWVWIGKSSFFNGLSQNHYQSQWWLAMWKLYLKKNLLWYRIKLRPNLSVIHVFKNDVCKIPVVFVQAPKYPPVAELYYSWTLRTMQWLLLLLNPHAWRSHQQPWYWLYMYRQVSNIRRTKSQHLKDSRIVLRLSLPNPLKPHVKSRMKM